MSQNEIRLLRKAVRLKFRSTIPNIGKFHNDTIRIWVPSTADINYSPFGLSTRNALALNLAKCIKASGIPYLNKDKDNSQPCYFIIEQQYLEALIGWIRLWRNNGNV